MAGENVSISSNAYWPGDFSTYGTHSPTAPLTVAISTV